ncbi:zinc uptake regulator, Fur family [Fictibacillus solisalsi]|uniref:Zinc uptake regulator, Fur family n=1 Tax=Fictibacillus solisalsi TaxID=459525 RepID=A0A1G9WCD3_9BACL|nr:Fur family transcriptional regulator [Fictibacillus solisalsi]SDM82198.1 zinc uptake regulator, Fur family [Fictibacillus solisalsi]
MDVLTAMDLLKKKGFKYTDKRRDLLKLFSDEKRYLSAKEVQDALKENYPGLSFDTIYRNLSTFSELDILEETELEGEKKFRFTCPTKEHHHHLICLKCGKTKEINACPMENVTTDLSDFQVTGHKFEIYGVCQVCIN